MSINKVSPALKRYKPGEISKKMINSMDLENTSYDLKINSMNEELNYVIGSKFSMTNMTNRSVQKFESSRNGPKISLNNQVVTNTNNSKENCLVLNYKSQSIDEAFLDASFEKLKNSIKNKNTFNKFVLTIDFKEHLLPEKVFSTDSILIKSNSLVGENYTYVEKDKIIFVEKYKNLQDSKNFSQNAYTKTFSDTNQFHNSINDKGQVVAQSDLENKNLHHNQESYLNYTNSEYETYRHNKIQSTNIEDNKIQINTSYDNLSIVPNSCSLGTIIPEKIENKDNLPKIEITLLSKKRKGPELETNIEKTKNFDDQTSYKDNKSRKNVFKTLRNPSEDGQNMKLNITTPYNNNNSVNSVNKNSESSINYPNNNCTKNTDIPSANNKKPLPNSRQISYFDFKKIYNIHKVEASISENKEEFVISYFRSDGIGVKYNILYDQKTQKILLIEKYSNNNLVVSISNDKNQTDIVNRIQSELCELLKDISANVMKKPFA